jgi:hypothetical protein
MTIRETIYAALTTDDELRSYGIDVNSVWNIESVDNPDRQKPFVVTAWADERGVYGRPGRRDLLVWAHDEGGDYSLIDRVLERIRILLVGMIHQGGVTVVEYTGASPDLYDDGFRTITRNYGFRVIGAG